jgi:hypothetical protein
MRCHGRHNLADFDHFDVHFTQNFVENLTSYFSQVRILMQLFDALSFSFTQSFLEILNVQWRQICVTTFQKRILTSVSKMEECADTYPQQWNLVRSGREEVRERAAINPGRLIRASTPDVVGVPPVVPS